ncbi:hypothetical protein CCY97_07650 [Helicobacter sp. 10-6591]|nr:hypothetical protein CCY97_07650 [Helicobacter sp. 10-6591]
MILLFLVFFVLCLYLFIVSFLHLIGNLCVFLRISAFFFFYPLYNWEFKDFRKSFFKEKSLQGEIFGKGKLPKDFVGKLERI